MIKTLSLLIMDSFTLNYGLMLLQLSQWTSGRGAKDRMGHTHSLILRLELKAFTVICIKRIHGR